MKKALVIIGILTLALLVGSWGPITHNSLAQEIATQASDYYHNYRNSDFWAGCIAPDIALAASPGNWDARQSLFHSDTFVDAMKYINENETQNTMRYGVFIAGYEVHLICDGIESGYTALKKAPVSSDFGVDKLVGASGGGNIPDNLLSFMLVAWQRAYPGDASVTLDWLKKAEANFGYYMSGIYNPVSKADAEKYFSDYRAWYDQSVAESVAFLKARTAEPTIPPPTFTLAPTTPPATTIAPPTTNPQSGMNTLPQTFAPGINPVPPQPLGEKEGRPLVSYIKTFFQWFINLLRKAE